MKRRFTIIITSLLAAALANGQDPNFSQYEVIKHYYNPAFTGDAKNIRAGIAYRNLWPNVPGLKFPGPLSTYMGYVDIQLRNQPIVGGVGAFVLQDFEGEGYLRHTSGGLLYSYHASTKSAKPVFQFYSGFKISLNQLRIDWSRLEFSDQFDPTTQGIVRPSAFIPNNNGKKTFFDVDFGVAGRFRLSENITDWTNEVSFSVAHLVRPDISLTEVETILPMKFSGHAISSIPVKNFFLSPKVMAEHQEDFFVITPGITLSYVKRVTDKIKKQPFYIGFYYRNGFADIGNTRSFIFNVGHNGYWEEKRMKYQIGFSYDATMIGLPVNKTYGAFELTTTIVFYSKKLDPRCPGCCYDFGGGPLGPIE